MASEGSVKMLKASIGCARIVLEMEAGSSRSSMLSKIQCDAVAEHLKRCIDKLSADEKAVIAQLFKCSATASHCILLNLLLRELPASFSSTIRSHPMLAFSILTEPSDAMSG